MAIDPNSRPLVLLPSTPWDPNTRSTTGPNAVPAPQPAPQPKPQSRGGVTAGTPTVSAPYYATPPPASTPKRNPDLVAMALGVPSYIPNGGVAGFSNPLDNDTEYQSNQPLPELAQWNAPNSVRTQLADKNWGLMAPEQETAEAPTALVDMKRAKPLERHSYTINNLDWGAMQSMGAGQPGEAAPRIEGQELQAAPMTSAAYSQLTDDQRRAVDFNTLLLQARDQDLKQELMLEGEELAQYQKDVVDIFGDNGWSDRYAPNTINLLKKLGSDKDGKLTTNFKGQDLDDFLSMENVVTLDKLLDFKLPQTPNMLLKPTGQDQPNQNLFDFVGTRSMDNRDRAVSVAIRNANQFIETNSALKEFAAPTALMSAQYALTGDKNRPIGWGVEGTPRTEEESLKEQRWREAYDFLLDPTQTSLDPLWNWVNGQGFDDADKKELFAFIDDTTKYEMRAGAGGEGRRSPQDVRAILGWED